VSDNAQAVVLTGIHKAYGEVVAVQKADLTVPAGSFVTLLGPSGCGKTTLLKMIAGLEDPTRGEIVIKGRRINEVPIHKRNLGMVFQNYALFPHMSVFDNIAFGLRYRQVPRAEVRERVTKALAIVRLPGVERRYPAQLSGGQQQRIALARAIVIQPDVLLLDEPLSALDANLREEMRVELKRIQREIGVTTVFVTHDQDEALAMSDQVVVMNTGHVEQVGRPEEVYRFPETRFVADFLGQSNILRGKVQATEDGMVQVKLANGETLSARGEGRDLGPQPVEAVIRAHRVQVLALDGSAGEGLNRYRGVISDMNYLGGMASYFVDLAGERVQAINPIAGRIFREGETVALTVAPEDCVLLNEAGRRIH